MYFEEDFDLALYLQFNGDDGDASAKPSCLDIPGTTPVKKKKKKMLIHTENKENVPEKPTCIIDPSWEYIDPTPDIRVLFMQFNKRFFWQTLDSVEVKWSPRMTSCAGVCSYEGLGRLCSIRLSLPLLRLRPRKDLVETLLHEMIHAYLFLTDNDRDRDGHGPTFCRHMDRINKEAGTNITIYHSFIAEVELYQQHWWRCDGPCQKKSPFFGTVKRAMNRSPGPTDFWWAKHQATCGGTFVKVREPVDYGKKSSRNKKIKDSQPDNPNCDIRKYFPESGLSVTDIGDGFESASQTKSKGGLTNSGRNENNIETGAKGNVNSRHEGWVPSWFTPFNGKVQTPKWVTPFSGKGYTLGGGEIPRVDNAPPLLPKSKGDVNKGDQFKKHKPANNAILDKWIVRGTDASTKPVVERTVTCPVCNSPVVHKELNNHLDLCLQSSSSQLENCTQNKDETNISSQCSQNDSDGAKQDEQIKVNCPVCDTELTGEDLDRHLETCVTVAPTTNVIIISDDEDDEFQSRGEEKKMFPCPCCQNLIKEAYMNNHLDECLSLTLLKTESK